MPSARNNGVQVHATMAPYPIDGTQRIESASDQIALQRSVELFAQALYAAWQSSGPTGGLQVLRRLNETLTTFNEKALADIPSEQLAASA